MDRHSLLARAFLLYSRRDHVLVAAEQQQPAVRFHAAARLLGR